MKVKVLQWCPKVQDCVWLTLKDAEDKGATYKGTVIRCNHESSCYAWNDDGFCWINHTIETGKLGAEKIE